MPQFNGATPGLTYADIKKQYDEWLKSYTGTNPYNFTASDGYDYGVVPEVMYDKDMNALAFDKNNAKAAVIQRQISDDGSNIAYMPGRENGYVSNDSDSFTSDLKDMAPYVAAVLGAGTLYNTYGAGNTAAMGMDQIGALNSASGIGDAASGDLLAQSMKVGLGDASVGAGFGDAAVSSQLAQGILNPELLATGVGVGSGAGASSGLSGLLDSVGGVRGAVGLAGAVSGLLGSKDGVQTTTKEPWAPMQPYMLGAADQMKTWMDANKNGPALTQQLQAQLPQWQTQQNQRITDMNNYASNYAKRNGLLG